MAHTDNTTVSGIYCRNCGYDLRAQTAPHRCPECGRAFDPANLKTFLTRPRRGAVWRWAERSLLLLLLLAFLPAMGWGWLYWGWNCEQEAVAKTGARLTKIEPLGGETLKGYLGSAGWVLDRVRNADVPSDANLVYVARLKELQGLDLGNAKVTDAGLVHLKQLKRLRELELNATGITDAGLVHLEDLKGLQVLRLVNTQITGAGLAHLKQLKALQRLDLRGTQITDAGLVHLNGLKGLEVLSLYGTKVTTEGVDKLQASLPETKIIRP
ncbi:MAG: hypothetical protein ACHRHE_18975 [Tepidisphaerales bacterium]